MRVDEIQILLDQGRIALNQGRFDEALELLDRVLKEDEANEQALNLKGLLLFKQERFAEAVTLFGTLVKKYPEEPTLLMNLGLAYLKSEQFDPAIVELEKALSRNPGNPKIHNYLGLAYSGIGRLQDAQKHFMDGGSRKMADQMLSMLLAKSDSDDRPAKKGRTAPPPPAPEVEVEVEDLDEARVDDAFAATFGAEQDAPSDLDMSHVMTELPEAVVAAPPVARAVAAPPAARAAATRAVTPPAASAPASAPPPSPIPAPAVVEAHAPPLMAPTDILGSALQLLKDRYETVLETIEAGKNLEELARVLELSRDPIAPVDAVRPNLVRVQVTGTATVLARAAQALALEGNVRAEPRKKRYKGKDINSSFGPEADPVCELIGSGAAYLLAPARAMLFPLKLDGELIYLVEDTFFATNGEWRWENGRLPGQGGRDLHLVQLRGKGTVVMAVPDGTRLSAIRVGGAQRLLLPVSCLAAWFGNVVPVLAEWNVPGAGRDAGGVQFQGDGTVLVRVPND